MLIPTCQSTLEVFSGYVLSYPAGQDMVREEVDGGVITNNEREIDLTGLVDL